MAEDSTPPSRLVRRGPRRQPPPELSPGTRVAGYVVERRLGAGGYGTVYLARGDTGLVALKILPLDSSWGREEREVDVIRRMRHAYLVRLLGYVDWPENAPRFRVLIMEYVPGLPLDAWVRRHNPSALQVVEELLPLMEALEAVHDAGVVHRDVKASNILVRDSDGKPVLVDFGAGAYEGAPTVTTSVLPPGTSEYRGPEAWDFFRHHAGETGARYQPTPADDLWAVGVLLYWVLTDRMPFTGGDFMAIGTAVLHDAPVPPRELNPWVPEALERVCLRMLEKSPGARYADARAVHAALRELRAQADASWREPLFEHHGPHNATTQPQEQLARGQELLRRLERIARQPPRRGEAPTQEASTVPDTAGPRRRGWHLPVLVGILVLAVALGLLLSWKAGVSSEVGRTTQPFMSPEPFPIQWDAFFPDVVVARKPPDVGGDEAPGGQTAAAPVINARHSEKDMREKKTSQKPSPLPQASKASPSVIVCLGLSATAAISAGCATTNPRNKVFYEQFEGNKVYGGQFEGMVECPPAAVQAMKENGIAIGSLHDGIYGSGFRQADNFLPESKIGEKTSAPVAGTGVELRTSWGDFNSGGVFMGASIVTKDRVYTRLINFSSLDAANRHAPVCMEVWYGGEPGAPHFGIDPAPVYPGSNKEPFVFVVPRIQLKAVSRFY